MSTLSGEVSKKQIRNITGEKPDCLDLLEQNAGGDVRAAGCNVLSNVDKIGASDQMLRVITNERSSGEIGL